MYRYNQRPETRFSTDSKQNLDRIKTGEYSVLVGRNNCGKSYLLKVLAVQLGENAKYIGPQRYNNFNVLGYYSPNPLRKQQWHKNFRHQFERNDHNIDASNVNLQQAIADLRNSQREALFEIIENLVGLKLSLQYTEDNNEMAQKFVSCGGHNLSFTSSGVRLIATLVTSLLDDETRTFLIDEPELGISPEAQGILADFLFDRTSRQKYFPHIENLVFATHSTIFLDRVKLSNNFTIEKVGDEISISQIGTYAEFNRIHFFLLGNRFETLYLPSLIVIVEGKTDKAFVEKVLGLRYPQYQVSVFEAGNDARFTDVLNTAKGLLTDFQKSPYRGRIVPVLDSVHAFGLKQKILAMGIPEENIVVWPKNGIEHYYPDSIMNEIFGEGGDLVLNGDFVSRNNLTYKKADLAATVVSKVTAETQQNADLENMLLKRTDRILHC